MLEILYQRTGAPSVEAERGSWLLVGAGVQEQGMAAAPSLSFPVVQ